MRYRLKVVDLSQCLSSLRTIFEDLLDLYLINKVPQVSMSNETGSTGIKCDQCGITFTTQQDKEEHMKLEHKEGKGPTGVT